MTKNSKRSPTIWLGLVLSALSVWLFATRLKSANRPNGTIFINDKPNDAGKQLYNDLIQVVSYSSQAKFIAAQAAFETANFTSQIFQDNNNYFGMKFAGQINATGEKNGFAYYKNLSDSVNDFLIYYDKMQYKKYYPTLDEYIAALALNTYYTAPYKQYLSGVKHYYNLYFVE